MRSTCSEVYQRMYQCLLGDAPARIFSYGLCSSVVKDGHSKHWQGLLCNMS